MKLQDYIKYYIGCEVIVDGKERAKLIGGSFVPNSCNQIYYDLQTEEMKVDDIDFAMPYNDDADDPEPRVKLILRRLEDMTEEEAIAIARLCFLDRDKGYPDSDFKARKVGIGSEKPSTYEVRIDNDWYDEVIKIGFITGNIWRCNGSTEHLHNQSKVFHYRIKQGFDLFGLIDAGLAIDIKTIL